MNRPLLEWVLRIACVGVLLTAARPGSAGVELTLQGEGGIQRVRVTGFHSQPDAHSKEKILRREPEGSGLERVERNPETGEAAFASASYDYGNRTAYLATRTDVDGHGGSLESAVSGAKEGSVALAREAMIQVEIQRDAVARELTLFLRSSPLRTLGSDSTNTPMARFQLQVFPDLAMAEKSESDPERDALFFGEVRLSDRLSTRGFSKDHFRSWKTDDGWLQAVPTNVITVHLGVPDAEAAVVRLIADTGKESRVPSDVDLIAQDQKPAITMMWNPKPNPAQHGVTFRFSLSRRLPSKLVVYDVQGRRVKTLVNGVVDAGPQEFRWERADFGGNLSKSGVYFARFEADNKIFTKRFVLLAE